jgi:hypothetical protein
VRGVAGRYNVTLCSYCLVALRVAMPHGEFVSVGLGVGTRIVEYGCSSTVMLGKIILRGRRRVLWRG